MNKFKIFWYSSFFLIGLFLIFLTFFSSSFSFLTFPFYIKYLVVGALAFFCEYMDSSIGMGYGTTLTPILLIFGFAPLTIVPLVLISEMFTGFLAGFFHHKEKNVNLSFKSRSFKVILVLSIFSIIGVLCGGFINLSLSKFYVKLYIGLMILCVGLFLKFGSHLLNKFSWIKMIGIGSLAAFNKTISGGGYGPLLTGRQVLSGMEEKEAISITSVTEGFVCLLGIVLYLITFGFIFNIGLGLALVIGAVLSVPLAAKTVKVLPKNILKKTISYVTIFLGLLTIFKLFV